ncbi:hypothetical protein TSUD_341630 [Trifolium subterraneum]|uniref:Ubiquitin-like domain-containing protein n=1 Tax=Trifolium subterraneum TaxID=3900 RepID=A0A2Z6PF08_TRISU|nr:hypothetical protein TSUD_341630 [Trifolium subterraneum]
MRCSLRWIASPAINSDVQFLQASCNKEISLRLIIQVSKVKLYPLIEGSSVLQFRKLIRAHDTYPVSTTTVSTLKQKLIAEWPQGKNVVPKSVNDVKLIHAGKVLENTKTLADSNITFSDIPGAITMHVVVQPPIAKKKTGLFILFIYAFAKVVWLRVSTFVRV